MLAGSWSYRYRYRFGSGRGLAFFGEELPQARGRVHVTPAAMLAHVAVVRLCL